MRGSTLAEHKTISEVIMGWKVARVSKLRHPFPGGDSNLRPPGIAGLRDQSLRMRDFLFPGVLRVPLRDILDAIARIRIERAKGKAAMAAAPNAYGRFDFSHRQEFA